MADGKQKLVALVGAGCCATLLNYVPQFEGTILRGYKDPIGIVTACTGHTKTAVLGRPYTKAECETLLINDLLEHAEPVLKCAPALRARPYELASAISFAFNVGVSNFCGSTAAKKFNAGDFPGGCTEYSRWVMADHGRIDCRIRENNCYGVVERRLIERSLCEGAT